MRHLKSLLLLAVLPLAARAWDYDGHRTVNTLAQAALPKDFPAFVREPANAARITYLANVPDRWRSVDPWLKQSGSSWTDHFLDIEQLADAGLDAATVPSLRYDFAVAFAAGRAKNADKFSPIDPAKNIDHTREWPGFAPWAITEWTQKLRAAFGYLKAYEEAGGTFEEIANAQADAVYAMGVLGHYVGDCAQPLHTTVHHAGWVGANPNGYTTWSGFHSWIDSGFINKAGIKAADLVPRVQALESFGFVPRTDGRDPIFVAAMDYVMAQHRLVEPLYRLEKEGKLNDELEKTDRNKSFPGPVSAEGRAFIEDRLLTGGQMLGRLWVTAWKTAPADTYLRGMLARRQPAAAPVKGQPAMNLMALLLVGLGGAIGSIARSLIGLALPSRFPWATLLINVAGSLLIGGVMARLGPVETGPAGPLRSLLVIGFCGGFTTFSTFSWQTLEQMQRGQWGAAVANIFLSVSLCLLAVWLGFKLGRA